MTIIIVILEIPFMVITTSKLWKLLDVPSDLNSWKKTLLLYHQIFKIFDHCISIKWVSFVTICILLYALENILRRGPQASPDCCRGTWFKKIQKPCLARLRDVSLKFISETCQDWTPPPALPTPWGSASASQMPTIILNSKELEGGGMVKSRTMEKNTRLRN